MPLAILAKKMLKPVVKIIPAPALVGSCYCCYCSCFWASSGGGRRRVVVFFIVVDMGEDTGRRQRRIRTRRLGMQRANNGYPAGINSKFFMQRLVDEWIQELDGFHFKNMARSRHGADEAVKREHVGDLSQDH